MGILLVLAIVLTLAGTAGCPDVASPGGGPPAATAAHPHDPGDHGCHRTTPEPPDASSVIGRSSGSAAATAPPVAAPAGRLGAARADGPPTVDTPRPDGRDLLISHGIART